MSGHERRKAPRFNAEYAVYFDGGVGVTRNLSSTGVCFETPDCRSTSPETLQLYVTLNEARRETVLLHVTTARIERSSDRTVIAARIDRLAIVSAIPMRLFEGATRDAAGIVSLRSRAMNVAGTDFS